MKNEMLALILAGGAELSENLKTLRNQLYNLADFAVSLTSLFQTVPTQGFTMLESSPSINHLLLTIILETVQVGIRQY